MTTRAATNRAAFAAPINLQVIIQGDRALTEHWITIASTVDPLMNSIVGQSAQFMANLAANIHQPHIDTGETFASINAGVENSPDREARVLSGFGIHVAEIGPTTPQARFLEFGFTHVNSGRFIQYPFMLPAADITAPLFIDASAQVAELAVNRFFFSGPIAGATQPTGILNGLRAGLYTFSKFAGDARVAGIDFGGIRGAGLSAARAIGDINSIMRGAISTRITHRATGRFATGALSTTRSAVITGPSSQFTASAQRIYNRVSGRGTGQTLAGRIINNA